MRTFKIKDKKSSKENLEQTKVEIQGLCNTQFPNKFAFFNQVNKDLNSVCFQRYNNGERLDKLCKEFHYDYASFKPKLEAKGIKVDTNAGPKKLSKRVAAIDPNTKEIIAIYESISAAARAICSPGASARAIGNHISKYKDMPSISHGFYWKTKNTLPNIDEL